MLDIAASFRAVWRAYVFQDSAERCFTLFKALRDNYLLRLLGSLAETKVLAVQGPFYIYRPSPDSSVHGDGLCTPFQRGKFSSIRSCLSASLTSEKQKGTDQVKGACGILYWSSLRSPTSNRSSIDRGSKPASLPRL